VLAEESTDGVSEVDPSEEARVEKSRHSSSFLQMVDLMRLGGNRMTARSSGVVEGVGASNFAIRLDIQT
jgi:hypothetical protein